MVTNRIYGKATVKPVSNIVKVNRFREEESNRGEAKQGFSSYLDREMAKKKEQPTSPKQEKLRLMGGLVQYDRNAREFCYILSREADYKA